MEIMSCVKDREGIYSIVGKKEEKVCIIEYNYFFWLSLCPTVDFIPFLYPRVIDAEYSRNGQPAKQTKEPALSGGSEFLDRPSYLDCA